MISETNYTVASSDIENNIIQKYNCFSNNIPVYSETVVIDVCEDVTYEEFYNFIKIPLITTKISILLPVAIFCLPMPIGDIYYAYTDNSCVHNSNDKLYITLSTYMYVSGIWALTIFGFVVLTTLLINEKTFACIERITNLVGFMCKLFVSVGTIIGALLFWVYTDTVNCSKPVYNWLFATIIIKILLFSIVIITSKNKKD